MKAMRHFHDERSLQLSYNALPLREDPGSGRSPKGTVDDSTEGNVISKLLVNT
jgi:hypothetical protein